MLILGNSSAYAPDLFAGAVSQGGGSDIPTTLGSRIDNKATVVGVLQDHEGNDYVLAVVDAAYRSGSGMKWGEYSSDTQLEDYYPGDPNSTTAESLLITNTYSGKYNTDYILSTYIGVDYPAFNFARNACTVTLNGITYYSVLPSLKELQLLYLNKNSLDQYDPTVSEYSNRSMSNFNCGAYGLWSSTEQNSEMGNLIYDNGHIGGWTKNNASLCSVCPVFCIPLS